MRAFGICWVRLRRACVVGQCVHLAQYLQHVIQSHSPNHVFEDVLISTAPIDLYGDLYSPP
jgi:hypothetical protein